MENQKNLFLAIIISMAIIFGFQLLVPQQELAPVSEDQTSEQSLVDLSLQGSSSGKIIDRSEVIDNSGRVAFNNSKIKGSINLAGALIDDLILMEFQETLDPTSQLIEFLNPLGSENSYYIDTGWVSSDSSIELPSINSIWEADRNSIGINDPVKLSWTNSQDITFEKIVSLDEDLSLIHI